MHIRSPHGYRITKDPLRFGSPEDWKIVCEGRRLEDGLQAAVCSLKEGKSLSRDTAYCLLQGCSKNKNLEAGKLVLSLINQSNLELVAPLGDPLIRLFASHGQLSAAYQVFSSIKNPGSHSWYAIISAHVSLKEHKKALTLYSRMLDYGILPSKFMFSCTLKACASEKALGQGMLLHDQIVEGGLETEIVVGSALIGLYAKCGCLEEAHGFFCALKPRNVVCFNTLMSGYVRHGENSLAWELFEKMLKDEITPDEFSFSCILKACGSSQAAIQGACVHKIISEQGAGSDVVVGNALVDMYFKCGDVAKAWEVFNGMPRKNIVSWNTVFMGYSSSGRDFDALKLFEKMPEGFSPTRVTYLCVIKACGNISAVGEGRWVHDKIIKSGLASDVELGSALVLMYAHCGSLSNARCIFDILSNKDDVLWCAMITAYAEGGCSLGALELYDIMQEDNMTPDSGTFVCVLKACAILKARSHGKLVHDHVSTCGLGYDVAVRNSLINMYIKCGKLDEAVDLFNDFPNKNLVSWNAMMTGYVQHELGFPALQLFEKMLLVGLKPDKVSFLCALRASVYSGAILQGRLIHDLLSREGLGLDKELGISLIDMYAKCGSLEEACRVFELVREYNIVLWGFLLSDRLQKSDRNLAVQHFDQMRKMGLKPGNMVCTSILSAYSQGGELEEGCRHFNLMTGNFNSMPSIEHYNCIIDNLGRTGHVFEAEKLLQTMPLFPDIFGWMSLLTACKTYGYAQLEKQCCNKIALLDPKSISTLEPILRVLGKFSHSDKDSFKF